MSIRENAARQRADHKTENREIKRNYPTFDQLDGSHPWMEAVPTGYVPYRVRELRTGEVAFFNYVLAKEMGLIPANHPHEMNEELKAKVLSTFSIQIINEFDQLNGKKFDASTIKPNPYMASRYLQLQHTSRSGKTSGDGRGIWNGVVEHQGQVWDVSSRGTGVTCLAPGAVTANRPLKTGGTEFGYGCGLAEMDELYGAALMSEIMHLQGFATERVLCLVDLGKGYGIGVRAGQNLLRPAHLFLYLKQNRIRELKSAANYLIQRQNQNGKWKINPRSPQKFEELAREAAKSFASFAAQLEVNYIFAWLDWDGDNVLADGGIIDYGSVRQFGIRHDLYRYDDVERFSTCLNEQKHKARLIAQVYVQMADYLHTGTKKPLKSFDRHPTLQLFDETFKKQRADRILFQMGFDQQQRANILAQSRVFRRFDRVFSYLERAKITGTMQKVADGVNRPALFNLRAIFRELPKSLLNKGFTKGWMAPETFFRHILSDCARARDSKMKPQHVKAIFEFQDMYKRLVMAAEKNKAPNPACLTDLIERAEILNHSERITGNALINIVEAILKAKRKGLSHVEIQKTIENLVSRHMNIPEVQKSRHFRRGPQLINEGALLSQIFDFVLTHRHDI